MARRLIALVILGICVTAVPLLPNVVPTAIAAETDAEKALKARHQAEWRALKERQKAELEAMAGRPANAQQEIRDRHKAQVSDMKARHKQEWRALKAGS